MEIAILQHVDFEGPAEIENTLIKHPAVAIAAVVGIPDPIRTESVKAWIVLPTPAAPLKHPIKGSLSSPEL